MQLKPFGLAVLFAVLLAGDAGAQFAATKPSSLTAAQRTAVLSAQTVQPKAIPPASGGVDWRLASALQKRSAGASQALASSLDPAAVDRTAVPILLPNDAGLMAGARLYSFGDYYTVTANTVGGHVSLTGTTATIPVSTPLNMGSQAPSGLIVQRTVDGQLASFVRFGVLYSVEVRCNAPADPKCRNDAFVRAVAAKSTVVLMGAAARKAAGLGN
jgi:hypothetical protein